MADLYRKRVDYVSATQWNKHGDYAEVAELPNTQWYRGPCPHCGGDVTTFKKHGWLPAADRDDGYVCPGDWVVDGEEGYVVMSDRDFRQQYEEVC